jgi:hypothetical protein
LFKNWFTNKLFNFNNHSIHYLITYLYLNWYQINYFCFNWQMICKKNYLNWIKNIFWIENKCEVISKNRKSV